MWFLADRCNQVILSPALINANQAATAVFNDALKGL